MSETTTQFENAPYASLATFRKTGAAVRTPVWIAGERGVFFVFSAGAAGKVKRLRNSDRAELAVCDVRGKVLGPWVGARGSVIGDPATVDEALGALRRKYGWQMWLADVGAKLTGKFDKRAYIKVELTGD